MIALRVTRRRGLLLGVLLALCLPTGLAPAGEPDALRVVGDKNYPPYLFLDPDGEPRGYLVDLWQLWEQKTGIPVALHATTWGEAQRRVLSGEADVIENIFHTPAREALYDFSAPYATLPTAIYAHESIQGLRDIDSLRGLRVGVLEGDVCVEHLQQHGIDDLNLLPSYRALIQEALREDVKVFCMDEAPANYYLYAAGAHKRFRRAFELYQGQSSRAVRKGKRDSLRLVERGMAQISDSERAALRRQWMGQPIIDGQVARHLGWVILVLVLAGALLLFWTRLLRRQVRSKTRELQQALEEVRQAQRQSDLARDHLEQEVTDRTAALAAAVEEQQIIFDTATSGIALIKDRVLQRCNRRLHELFGWPPGSMVGQPTTIWYPDEAANIAGGESVYAHIWKGESHQREQQLVRRDGSLFWARLTGNAIDCTRPEKGTVWIIDDISAEHATLERMREAKALAEEAARAKSDFLANMSHEIRTPMNTIIGMTHLALQADPSARQRDYLNQIRDAGQHLLDIVNGILDFTEIDAGKLKLVPGEFDLDQLLEDLVQQITRPCEAKGLRLQVMIEAALPRRLIGDPARLRQILMIYADNAIKFTRQGQIGIDARLAAQDEQGLLLRVAVHDTGIGIDAAQRKRLFQAFLQADGSKSRKYGGTGLGLALAQRLTALMGGSVGVDSEPGVGSTFWFTARLGIATHQPRSTQPHPYRRPAGEAPAALPQLPTDDVDTEAPATPAEIARRQAILSGLARRLADDDFAVGQYIDEHHTLLTETLGRHFRPLVNAIQHYDFHTAAELLDRAAAERGIPLDDQRPSSPVTD
ncbi:ATP-binding protein [Thiohalocapsa marina]|nr:transporter substrate-binding domain-containing protein [Thiohalocapsa marina]